MGLHHPLQGWKHPIYCKYPTEFSIFARIVEANEESVTIDRFSKFGALPVGKVTLLKKDFERYYKRINNENDKISHS